MNGEVFGKISSFQTLGTLDGPGVRFVVFMQGCPLRCACCHNPETWDVNGGKSFSASEIFAKITRYKEYFSQNGGVTLSGGEPLVQPEFCTEIFKKCRQDGIHTCLDTSGFALNEKIKTALEYTDYCMLDVKYTSDEDYKKYVGCEYSSPLAFLDYLDEKGIATRLRQVIIKGLNDSEENILRLKSIADSHKCVKEIELLPFRKLCASKYDKLNITFPLADFCETGAEDIENLNKMLKN